MKVLALLAFTFSASMALGATLNSYRHTALEYCIGAFATGQCTVLATSSGNPIDASGSASTSGESASFSASAVSRAGDLGGRVTVTTNTINSTGPGIMVDAISQMVDLLNISYAPLQGSIGYMQLNYTIHGTNSATGADAGARFGNHGVPYACVKIGIGEPIFPFGCVAYDQALVNTSVNAGVVQFTYGSTFPLWFQLETIAGTGFGTGRSTGPGTSAAEFYNTASITGVVLFDSNMQPVQSATISSDLGVVYSATPEPSSILCVLSAAPLLILVRRARLMSGAGRAN